MRSQEPIVAGLTGAGFGVPLLGTVVRRSADEDAEIAVRRATVTAFENATQNLFGGSDPLHAADVLQSRLLKKSDEKRQEFRDGHFSFQMSVTHSVVTSTFGRRSICQSYCRLKSSAKRHIRCRLRLLGGLARTPTYIYLLCSSGWRPCTISVAARKCLGARSTI